MWTWYFEELALVVYLPHEVWLSVNTLLPVEFNRVVSP
jgi:hypothetical protein